MSGLTGFSRDNNLVENLQDRQSMQNLLPDFPGVADDIALLVNNVRNESILEIKISEINDDIISIVNTPEEFISRSNVFSNGDTVDIYHLGVKQNIEKVIVINSNSLDTFQLSQDGTTPMDLSSLAALAGVINLIRSDAINLVNFTYCGISDIDYVNPDLVRDGSMDTYENIKDIGLALSKLISDLEFTKDQRKLKYRSDSSLSISNKLSSEGVFIAKGSVDNPTTIPGLYITDATSSALDIQKVRAFSNDNNPWTNNSGVLETEASAVTIGKLVFNEKIEIDGLPVNNGFGNVQDVFTHKLPVIIDGQQYFLCLNKPT